MLAMSVFFAIKDAIASVGDYKITPILDAPATPEKIFKAARLGSHVKGGLEVARQLYHDHSITDLLVQEVIPGVPDLLDSISKELVNENHQPT